MATIKDGLMTFLLGKTAITSLVGRRIYFHRAPQDEAFPYIVIQRVSNPGHPHMTNQSKMASPTFQFDIYSETSVEAESIEEAIRNAMDWKRNFLMDDIVVRVSAIENMFDDVESIFDAADEHDGIYRNQISMIIWYYRTVPTLT